MIPKSASGGSVDPAGIPPVDVPMTEATIDGDSHLGLSVEQHSTKSSQGRKLRQVLQKKQLDVLLQTYSSYIEEPTTSADGGAGSGGGGSGQQADPKTDRFTISRKQSIEGNVVHQLPHHGSNRQQNNNNASDIQVAFSGDSEVQVLSTSVSDPAWKMRKQGFQDNSGGVGGGGIPNAAALQSNTRGGGGGGVGGSDTELESDEAVMASRFNNFKNNFNNGRKGRKKHYVTSSSRRTKNNSNNNTNNKRGGGGTFSTRMQKANEVVKGFTNRCGQKHLEIAEDFQEATKELQHHLKSGADVAFEDLADQFDGIVNDLFVGENEQRDDDGGRGGGSGGNPQQHHQPQHHQQQRGGGGGGGGGGRNTKQHGVHVNWPHRNSSSNSQREGNSSPPSSTSAFEPLSHDEALLKMNKQVKENLWRPAKNFAERVYEMNCGPTGNGVAFEIEPGRVVRLPSF